MEEYYYLIPLYFLPMIIVVGMSLYVIQKRRRDLYPNFIMPSLTFFFGFVPVINIGIAIIYLIIQLFVLIFEIPTWIVTKIFIKKNRNYDQSIKY